MLLCDEPTGNLDHHSAGTVASLLLDLHRDQQTILIVVTHSAELACAISEAIRDVGTTAVAEGHWSEIAMCTELRLVTSAATQSARIGIQTGFQHSRE
jgi:energy-coupling factor transporter ATP-binding protein EcfA2